MNPCPFCEIGNPILTVDFKTYKVPLWYKKCPECKIEFGDEEVGKLNKLEMLKENQCIK